MSKTNWMWAAAAGLAAVVLMAGVTYAEEGCKAKVELPEAAAKAIKDAFPEAAITGVEAEDEDGMKVFEVELKVGAGEVTVSVAPCGTILEVETVVAIKDVPKAAAEAIQKAAEGAQIKGIEKAEIRAEIKKDDAGKCSIVKLEKAKIVYEADLIKGDQTGEIVVAADGTIVEALKWVSAKDEKEKGEKGAAGQPAEKGAKGAGCGGCGK